MSEFYKKLTKVQSTLNAPKGQFNSFGKYNYRSCEDIMGALKPLLAAEGLFQFITDDVEVIGNRHYMTAGCSGTDNHTVSNAGFTFNINSENILTFQVINFVDNKILECFTLQVFPLGE